MARVAVVHVRDPTEARRHALTHLRTADEACPPRLRAARRLEDAVVGEERHDRVEVVTIERGGHLLEDGESRPLVGHASALRRAARRKRMRMRPLKGLMTSQ